MVELTQKNLGLKIAGSVFVLIATVHLGRALSGMSVAIGNVGIPVWCSWVAALGAGTLGVWLLRLAMD